MDDPKIPLGPEASRGYNGPLIEYHAFDNTMYVGDVAIKSDGLIPTGNRKWHSNRRRVDYVQYNKTTHTLSIYSVHDYNELIIVNVETGIVLFYHNIGTAFSAVPVINHDTSNTVYFHRHHLYVIPHGESHLPPCDTYHEFTQIERGKAPSKPLGSLTLSVLTPSPDDYLNPDFSKLTDYGKMSFSGVEETSSLTGSKTMVVARTTCYTSILDFKEGPKGPNEYECKVVLGLLPNKSTSHFTISSCSSYLIWCEVKTLNFDYVVMCFTNVRIHYVHLGRTEEAPLFTVEGRVESLKFSENGSAVVAVLKNRTEICPLF